MMQQTRILELEDWSFMYLPSQWLTNTKKKKNILTSDHAIVLQKKKKGGNLGDGS